MKKILRKKTVFVGMSGGVDSSVAAFLLKKEGYNVVGVFMRCYNLDGCSDRDAEDARRVAEHINISFYVWDFEEDYKKRVVEYMIDGYRCGITPNPDVMCNREIKFGLFFEKAIAAGADYVATGHYLKIKKSRLGSYELFEANDSNKDQSYFLWTLTQKQLQSCLFPIGKYKKSEVRVIARKAKLPTAEKKDSQGICFLGKISLVDFLKRSIPEKKGALMTMDGTVVGEHSGATFYTIGQRHLGVPYKTLNSGNKNQKPFYVVEKNIEKNIVTVVEGSDSVALYKKDIELVDVNLISKLQISDDGISVFARVRYRQPLSKAKILFDKRKGALLFFDKPQKFVAKGQSVVFYSKNGKMLGGGIII